MPRAYRYFIPGQVWHITHRCHEKGFLQKFARDRDDLHTLPEEGAAYEGHSSPETGVLSVDNAHFWKEKILTTET